MLKLATKKPPYEQGDVDVLTSALGCCPFTPLHWAQLYHHEDVVEVLSQHGGHK
jgi:hypothetical protein